MALSEPTADQMKAANNLLGSLPQGHPPRFHLSTHGRARTGYAPILCGQVQGEHAVVDPEHVHAPAQSVEAVVVDGLVERLQPEQSIALLARLSEALVCGGELIVRTFDIESATRRLTESNDFADKNRALRELYALGYQDGWYAEKMGFTLRTLGLFIEESLSVTVEGESLQHLEVRARKSHHENSESLAEKQRTVVETLASPIERSQLLTRSPTARGDASSPKASVTPTPAPSAPPSRATTPTPATSLSDIQTLAQQVERHLHQGEMSQARDSARALLSALPEQVDIMLTLANIELSLGNLEAAEAQLIKAGIVAPDDEALRADLARSLETLARHFEQRGEPDRAALSRSRANRKPAKKTLPTASVVVLCYNQLSLTKECIDSVLAHTSTAYELIVVDNASSDDTASYLEGLAEAHEHVRVILNHDNLGFAGGNNCGMAIAEGDVVVLLNNDTVVTDGWLSGMLETFVRHPEAMLVGPRSNYVTGPQLVERVDYRDVETLAGFGAAWKNAHRGKDEEVSRVIGFCMAIRRPLLEQIGGLDEGFGRGNFEDDDYCLRCRAHGHRVFISHEVFIHHEGGQSFKAAGIDYQNLLLTNWNFFKRKWGLPAEANIQAGYAADLKPPATALAPVALPPIDSTYSSNASGRILRQSRSASTDTSSASDPARPASDGTSIDDRGTAFDNAEAAAANGDWPLATTLFSDMTKQYPSFAPGFVGLASSLFASGHVEEGGNALEAACDLEPENLALRVQLGVTMAHAGILQRAEKAFVKVLSIDPDHLDALLSLAQLCRASDHLPEAVQLVSHAHQVHPTEPDVIAAVAELALQLGDEEAAKMTLAELRRLDPEHPLLQT